MKNIRFEKKENIGTITLDRPQKLNALSPELFEELASILTSDLTGLRGLILTGAGGQAFAAGADIAKMQTMSPLEGRFFAARAQEITEMMEALPIPIIAAVDGFALGGGCELAMACDFIFATQHSTFGQPEVQLGLIPGFGGCVRLMHFVGPARARELIYSGRKLPAKEAFQLGLVNSIFESREELLTAARATLKEIAEKSAPSVAIAKQTINRQHGHSISEGLQIELEAFSQVFGMTDRQEGISAFLQKRKPRY